MDIYSVSWSPEDHVEELCNIIKDGSVEEVEKRLVEYVVDTIEPTGWRAVWKLDSLRNPPGAFKLPSSISAECKLIVDVVNVSQDSLEAEVRVIETVPEFLRTLKSRLDATNLNGNDEADKLDENQGTKINASSLIKEFSKLDSCLKGDELDTNPAKKRKVSRSTTGGEEDTANTSHEYSVAICSSPTDEASACTVQATGAAPACNTTTPPESDATVAVSSTGTECRPAISNSRNKVRPANGLLFSARLWELQPLVEQENDVLIITTAEVIELIRFFYEHIFYPWDTEAEYCCYDYNLIAQRYQIYLELSGAVPGLPAGVAAVMRRAVRDSWATLTAINQVEESSGVGHDGFDVPAEAVQRLLQLHHRLDALRDKFEMLRDPVMRQLSSHERSADMSLTAALSSSIMSTSSAYESSCSDDASSSGRVWLVAAGCSVQQLQQHIQLLPQIMQQYYPQCAESSVTLHNCLQVVLDRAAAGDVVLLLPGSLPHTLHGLGTIGYRGGAIHGVGKDVLIEASSDSGDVMMHISVDAHSTNKVTGDGVSGFSLRNVTLECRAEQTAAVLVHGGDVTLDNVNINGGCETGVLVSSTGVADGAGQQCCRVLNCRISNCSAAALQCAQSARLSLSNTRVENCATGIKMHANATVSVVSSSVSGSSCAAVEVLWPTVRPQNVDDNPDDISADQILPSLLSEYKDVLLTNNRRPLIMSYSATNA